MAVRMNATQAARVCGHVSTVLAGVLERETDANTRNRLAQDLASVSPWSEPAQAMGLLAAYLERETDANARSLLASAMSAVAARMEPAEAAKTLAEALGRTTEAGARSSSWQPAGMMGSNAGSVLASALSAVAARMEPAEATRVCGQAAKTLAEALARENDAIARSSLASALANVANRLDATGVENVAVTLVSTRDVNQFAWSGVLVDAGTAEFSRRAGLMTMSIAQASSRQFPYAAALAAEPFPCCLTTQELVELLKMPTCFGEARRVVLDHLGNRYGRRFVNHWAFVRYARDQNLGLDFTTPPKQPDPRESVKRMLEILDRSDVK